MSYSAITDIEAAGLFDNEFSYINSQRSDSFRSNGLNHFLKTWVSLFGILFLISCSGGSSTSLVSNALDSKSNGGKVFVVRDTGSVGMIYSISVLVNGQNIGKIGMKETAVGNTKIGVNKLSVSMGGLAGLSTSDGTATFNNLEENKNRFFVIGIRLSTLTGDLTIKEVSEKQFRSKALNTSWKDYL